LRKSENIFRRNMTSQFNPTLLVEQYFIEN
jgi:hypothetical protein